MSVVIGGPLKVGRHVYSSCHKEEEENKFGQRAIHKVERAEVIQFQSFIFQLVQSKV